MCSQLGRGWILSLFTLDTFGEGAGSSSLIGCTRCWVTGGAECLELSLGLQLLGGVDRDTRRSWSRGKQGEPKGGGAQRKGQGAGMGAGPRNEGRSEPTGKTDCPRGGATLGD